MSRVYAPGFIAAAFVNTVGVLIFSRGLTNAYLGELYPEVFGSFGLICIMLWGLAYLSVAWRHAAVPTLVLVFALEKAVYSATWFIWLSKHSSDWSAIWQRDPLTATFYAIYGPNDLLFALFFAWRWYARCRG